MEKYAYINGEAFAIEENETILSFLRRARGEKYIPTLCDSKGLEPHGSCRVCSVEAAFKEGGPFKTVASCHTPIAENMYLKPQSQKIKRLRKNIVELVLSDHPLDCLTCEVNGNCELQSVAAEVGIREMRYPTDGKTHQNIEKDLSHPFMTSDLSKCINCYRCVRACDEIQGEHVLGVAGRGFDSRIIKGMDVSFNDSTCVSCGACSQACPTSAISDVFQSKSVVSETKTRTICTYCGVGCNLDVAVVDNQVKSIQAPWDAEVNAGHTCVKGRYAFKFASHPDRLTSPLIRKNGVLEKASWDEAFDYLAEKLNQIKKDYGPEAIGGISSARCTNEENYLMQKLIRNVIGTNNIDCCARVCHAPTAYGMQQSFGTGAATNSYKDLKKTDLILIVGANPTSGHPVMGSKIKQEILKGKPLIVIDPRKTPLAKYAKYHLALRPGTNVAMLNMWFYYILEAGMEDKSFIQNRTEGWNEFVSEVKNLNIAQLEQITGVDRELVKAAALEYASAEKAMSFHGLGVTEHSQGSKTVMLLSNLAMLTGNLGREGVGINPLRGQNNVQGAADMGVQPHQGPGYLSMDSSESQEYYFNYYKERMPEVPGLKIPQMFDSALNKELKALWIMGEDVAQTDPNTKKVKASLSNLELLVVQELFLTETAKLAHVVLPGSSFLEKEGTFTNAERRVQKVNRAIPPLAGSKPDGQIIVEMMNKLGYSQKPYSAKEVLEEISQVVPFFKGISWDNLGINGKQWPVAEDGTDTQILHQKEFKRGLGKFHFFNWVESNEIESHGKKYPYILTTGRELFHYNCGTMTRRTYLNQIMSEDLLLVNPKDAKVKGIHMGQMVKVVSARGEVKLKAKITEDVNPGVVYTTFHFPEEMVNQVTSDEHDAEALCPEYKIAAVDLVAIGSTIKNIESEVVMVAK